MIAVNKDILKVLGEKIRIRREELSYSQNDVADLTGLTTITILALEKGRGTTLNNFLLICRALQIQPRDLFESDIELTPLFALPPESQKRIEKNQKLDHLVYDSDFFETPRRVSDVIKELGADKADSNKYSVYLTGYCKEGGLDYVKEGNYKKYLKRKGK
ncbi:DNA-binding transcriptional regulator, XRE-family HTH domain [Sphingobacterium nematocida]|uniref:DNA-binding transcriptional regulator, XRE-family HTH domain n=1 Tax=Sphingobacterium nematocida TaxID=1513896 RepID=A0A1T5FBW2_9SPHI|nr:helix-turn-helix transcriptional regulator [Sphingobacterium nematocida]SKB93650.1 DNA-binding transcriptional regulator, XRE-family HTH domain [Sphingobacterium nematocida]